MRREAGNFSRHCLLRFTHVVNSRKCRKSQNIDFFKFIFPKTPRYYLRLYEWLLTTCCFRSCQALRKWLIYVSDLPSSRLIWSLKPMYKIWRVHCGSASGTAKQGMFEKNHCFTSQCIYAMNCAAYLYFGKLQLIYRI